jgi:putative sterol carrier protein
MSVSLAAAAEALATRLEGQDLGGSIKFLIEDKGALRAHDGGVTIDDGDADCTIAADSDTFQEMLAGDLDPTAAFMSGRLRIDGDMGLAMRLASLLA